MTRPATPAISEVAVATLGVADLDVTEAFYRDVFGYETRARGTVPEEYHRGWRMPPGSQARFCLLARPGSTRGMLRLVQADSPGAHIWGCYERIQDHGHYAINFRVPDVHAIWQALLANGVRPKSAPLRWDVDETMVAWDSQCWDPDGTLLDVYTMEGRPDIFTPLEGRASSIETVAIHVADADRSHAFYRGLGFSLFFDRRIDDLGAFFHLPDKVVLRDVNLIKPELSSIGRIEIVELEGLPGLPVEERAHPPNLGILSISFETDDIERTAILVAALGGRSLTAPHRAGDAGLGKVQAFSAFGPDGELLEFVQPDGKA